MPVKDYYQILELEPGATVQQIRRNFRLLAKRYHPDINTESRYHADWFREVQEAYAVLANPAKKEAYLRQRWLSQSMGKPLEVTVPQSPARLLADLDQLMADYSSLDHFRFDAQAWQMRIAQLISPERIALLHTDDQRMIRIQVIEKTLLAAQILPWPCWIKLQQIWEQMAAGDRALLLQIGNAVRAKRRDWWWAKHQWWLLLLLSFVLCASVYVLAK